MGQGQVFTRFCRAESLSIGALCRGACPAARSFLREESGGRKELGCENRSFSDTACPEAVAQQSTGAVLCVVAGVYVSNGGAAIGWFSLLPVGSSGAYCPLCEPCVRTLAQELSLSATQTFRECPELRVTEPADGRLTAGTSSVSRCIRLPSWHGNQSRALVCVGRRRQRPHSELVLGLGLGLVVVSV